MTVAVNVSGLSVVYGLSVAVRGLELEAHQGETIAILGANGAGKTSTLKAIAGLVRPRSGRVVVDGRDVTRQPPWKVFDSGVVYVPQGRRCFKGLSVEQNLIVGGQGLHRRELKGRLDEVYEVLPALASIRKRDATRLSGGQQQMVAVGRGLMSRPRVLLLDEPSLGLAPRIVSDLGTVIRSVASSLRGTVILVEQNVGLALTAASRGYVMANGECVASGEIDDIVDRVREAYLGGNGYSRQGDGRPKDVPAHEVDEMRQGK